MNDWIQQKEISILDLCPGSTVLVKFRDPGNGITTDNGNSVDISWLRTGEIIHTTTGNYSTDDIYEYKVIT